MRPSEPFALNHFALNHMAAPRRSFAEFAALARSIGVARVEMRNDLPGVALADGTPAEAVRREADAAGVVILSINALQRFEDWSDAKAEEADALAAYARACGAAALVLCPTNDALDRRDEARRRSDLRTALRELHAVLSVHGVRGLVEPLGFRECALRRKRDAMDAIEEVGAWNTLGLLHDTFHHALAMEQEMFPEHTGLVHVSGVEESSLALGDMRDGHRVLVGPGDVLGTVDQVRRLREGGYDGPISFEPFSAAVHALPDIASALRDSMAALDEASRARPRASIAE